MTAAPRRTCLGCRAKRPRAELCRLALAEGLPPRLVWDMAGRASGRGGWLCPKDDCLQKARRKKGLWSRAFRVEGRLNLSALDAPPWQENDGIAGRLKN